MHADKIIPTFITSNIYFGLCLPKALTLIQLWLDEMFEMFPIISINKSVGLRGILNSGLLSDMLPSWLARDISLKEEVP